MESIEARVLRRAARQHAVISKRQALEEGLTSRQLEARVARGVLVRVHRGVYRMAGAPDTFEQQVMAACLASGGVASHRSAAALWALRGCAPGPVEVTVHERRRPELNGVVAHTTRQLDALDVSERCGIPVTTPARTLVDLGAVVPVEAVESALEDALLRGLVGSSYLARTLGRLARRGRDGVSVLRALLEARDPDARPTESALEDAVISLLRRAGVPEPARQHVVHLPGGRSLRIDLAYPELRLGIEADGRLWHSGQEDFQRNCAKANVLVALRWRILHFTWADVRQRPDVVVQAVRRELLAA